jgi:hopanoid biosynthesis associated RND transporter like protein HpnN
LLKFIVRLVAASQRRAYLVVVLGVLLGVLGSLYSINRLSLDSDTDHLFSASLPWRQAEIREAKDFPQFNGLIVAVVRGATPEEAAETARALNSALNADKAHFIDSSYPAGSPFYVQEGLLLLPADKLAKLLNTIVAAQPFLGQLAADPSSRGLFGGIRMIAEGAALGQANLTPYNTPLRGVAHNLAAAAGRPEPLSWQSLITGNLGGDAEFVLAHPILDQHSLQPGGAATKALKAISASLPDVQAHRATVDYTGQIPLSDEQFASLTNGLLISSIVSVALIALWLFLALRSWRLIIPILLTLMLGLALTFTFAAIAIKVLNLISVAFAILFIGLAVDFGIQFSVRLRDVRHGVGDLSLAIFETARQVGDQIALAAVATASGFLAFTPTPFVGVAELGAIAGAGMLIALLCTLTFLPATLWLFAPKSEDSPVGLPFGEPVDSFVFRHRHGVLGAFGILAICGGLAAATLTFDANPLDTKDPNTESMRTLRGLLNDPTSNPFYADILVPDLTAARALSQKLSALPEVSEVLSGATFVPTDQGVKLAMLAQVQNILAPTLQTASSSQTDDQPRLTAQDIRISMKMAQEEILQAKPKLPADSPLLAIADALGKLLTESDAQVMAMNAAVTRFLPAELNHLTASLEAKPITQATLPSDIARSWFLPDGQVRVEALPTAAAQTPAGLRKFTEAVLSVAPNAGGPAISTMATARTILDSFREAALLAALAIAIILFLVFRNFRDTLLVLSTLALSALLTALFAKVCGLQINYANIIALPLLLGVGVSFNVYFVMNFRAGMRRFLHSATALAVLFSALTTGTAFGTLAASHDRGTSSMGVVLLLSLLAVLIATFFYLPAMLYVLLHGRARKA